MQWAERDSNPLLFPEGFEAEGESGAESGTWAGGAGDGLAAAEGTRGNAATFRAGGAGPAGGRPGRPRVLPDANACSWPEGGAGGHDRVCFRRVSPVSPVPELTAAAMGAATLKVTDLPVWRIPVNSGTPERSFSESGSGQ